MLRSAIRNLLNLDDPPEKVALAFAVGIFFGFSPLVGLQTLLAALVAFIWKFNKLAIISGSYISNPWTMGPIIAAAWGLGHSIVGGPPMELPEVSLAALAGMDFWRQLAGQWRQLLPFAVGSMILSTAGGLISYPLMLHLIRSYRRKYGRNISLSKEPAAGFDGDGDLIRR